MVRRNINNAKVMSRTSDLFRRFNNWYGIEQILLDKAARALRGPEQNKILDCLDKSSPFLQWLFKEETADKIAEFRYGFNDARSACQVATDLLDVLLHISSWEQRHSSLHEYAWYLKIPFENQRLSINVMTNRQMSLRHVQTIEARAFAIAVTDAIMFARGRLNSPQAAGHLTETQSFWINSLWVFLPKCGVELLSHRAQNWPLNYVQTCWPELGVTRESAMLQSNQKALRSHFIHENTRLIRSRLANIRSN